MEIFVWIGLRIKNEARDHKPPNVKVSPKPIVKSILLMSKKLSGQKIIIVAIPIINSMNVDLLGLVVGQ
ncbi:MAG: hypothetical protein WCL18_01700 [bacterium]